MIIDGRAIAAELKLILQTELANKSARLDVILVGDDKASAQFVGIKERFGRSIGVEVRRHEYEANVPEEDLLDLITRLNADDKSTGIIIQLPLPAHLDSERLINLISPNKDVDALGKEARVLSPVVGAVAVIIKRSELDLNGKKAVVVGQGKLVGKPVSIWLTQEGAEVERADSKTTNLPELLKTADIIVSGAGQAYFIKPEMIKEGVILIDAGTSESGGSVVGDADPSCAAKCAIFTPVPGGVGPITVAKIFENLLALQD